MGMYLRGKVGIISSGGGRGNPRATLKRSCTGIDSGTIGIWNRKGQRRGNLPGTRDLQFYAESADAVALDGVVCDEVDVFEMAVASLGVEETLSRTFGEQHLCARRAFELTKRSPGDLRKPGSTRQLEQT